MEKTIDVFELFRNQMSLQTRVFVQNPIYGEEPARRPRRKKRRLLKKWLKRYGTKRVLLHVFDREIFGYRDLYEDEMQNPIFIYKKARAKQLRVVHAPNLAADFAASPSDPIPMTSEIYEFPVVETRQAVSSEMHREIGRNRDIARMLDDEFWKQVEPIVREKTTRNGFTGW